MAKKKSHRFVTLAGRPITTTDKAVKWADSATGYELWFPISMVKIEGSTIRVREWMYKEKCDQWKKEERELTKENARMDREDDEQLQRDLAEIDRKYGEAEKPSGCLTMIVFGLIITGCAMNSLL